MEVFDHIELKEELQQLVTSEQAWHYGIVPKQTTRDSIEFYIDDNLSDKSLKDELEMLFAKKILFTEVSTETIRRTLGKYYRKATSKSKNNAQRLNFSTGDFLINLISEASSINSSDIHLEPYEDKSRVRLRIDGKLLERYIIEKEEYPALVNKIKIKANLDIAEKRLPQDGRILFHNGGNQFDIRVSVLPTLHGEKIVLRLLSKDATNIELSELGFTPVQLSTFMEGIRNPHGIVLVSGPTGSGKTTSLYATLKILNKEETNILTIEDPIEYTLPGINQVQLKESIGLTFASALRTFLRQDPDIIMLGEIRDSETAQMAIRASLTGHLVLSTIHTNSAWGIISRLLDMGIPSFLLASTLNLVVAQRLVRVLCPKCKSEHPFTTSILPPGFKPPENLVKHFAAVGCESCYYTGYKGRKAVYEVLTIDATFAEAIRKETPDIQSILKEKGIDTLADSAYTLFANGETTIEEVYSILKSKTSE
jgi:general secretion pathway protein E/type IV pilus assembly protein PilB